MITSVTFDDTIPYAVDRRESRFDVDYGWTITEEQPGRVRLKRGDVDVVVQSMPYTLVAEARTLAGAGIGVISEATLGNREMGAEALLASGQSALQQSAKRKKP